MPFLSLVHLHELRCATCDAELATAGARSFVVGADGEPIDFAADDGPAEMTVVMICANGHDTELLVPNEIGAEETLSTPDEAPIAGDAVLTEGKTESGKPLGPLAP
ncbi:MAG TPA: hypothetical protein VIJ12_08355 [Candidatus Baltobacteraceae bacterium]